MSLLPSHSFPPPFPTISFSKLHSSNRHYSEDLQSNVVALHSMLSTPIISTTPLSSLQYQNHTDSNDSHTREEVLSRRQHHAITSPNTLLPPLILLSASHIHLIVSSDFIPLSFHIYLICSSSTYFSISKPHHRPSCSLTCSLLSHSRSPYFVPISYQHMRRVRLLGSFRPRPLVGPHGVVPVGGDSGPRHCYYSKRNFNVPYDITYIMDTAPSC